MPRPKKYAILRAMKRAGMKKRKSKTTRKPKLRSSVSMPLQQPDRVLTKLKYEATFPLANTSNMTVFKLFRGNGPRDPETKLALGHSAQLYNFYASIYLAYRCFGSKIQVTVLPFNDTVGGSSIESVVLPATTVGPFSDYDFCAMQKYARTRTYNLYNWNVDDKKQFTYYMSSAKIYGLPNSAIKNDLAWTEQVTADPSSLNNVWHWHIGLRPAALSAATNYQLKVKIIYYTEFFNAKYNLPPSLVDLGDQTGPTGVTGGGDYFGSADTYGRKPPTFPF